jgi:ribosomal protein S18 acetylase RimI-like enzyme
VNVARLEPGRLPEAAAVYARAFHDDPAWTWVIRDEERRTRLLPFVFERVLRLETGRVQVVTAGEGAGVAIWVQPGTTRPSLRRLVRSGVLTMPLRLRLKERSRLRSYLRACWRLQAAAVPEPHWYLSGLAVDPPHQRRGIGRTLVEWGCERAAAEGAPAALLTSSRENVRYYERLGFEVVRAQTDPLPLWAMVRG